MEGSVPVSDSCSPVRPNRKPLTADEEAMELLWQDGHPVVQRHPPHVGYGDTPTGKPPAGGGEDQTLNYGPLFIREDEIDSWLHYDEPFYGSDFWRFQDGWPSESSSATGESMLVASVHAALAGSPSFVGYGGGGGSTGAAKSEMMTPAQEPEPPPQRPRSAEDRKRTGGAEPEEAECDSEDAKFGATNPKKPRCRPPVPLRRSRSSEVHNRSERRRRDRINGKMRALQELIPQSAKAADKVSTLDCAIEYLKMLQQQLQMMSMGCGMVLMTNPSMSMGMSVGDPMPMFRNHMVPSAVPCPPFPASSPSAAAALPSVQSHPLTYLRPPGFAPIQFGTRNPPVLQRPLHLNFAYPYQQYPGLLRPHYSQ